MDSTVIGLTLPSMDARDKDWMFGLTTFCNEEYFSLEDSFIDKLSLVAHICQRCATDFSPVL